MDTSTGDALKVHSRKLVQKDFEYIRRLLLVDGTNKWNYITEEGIKLQFTLIKDGRASAILLENNTIQGVSVLIYRLAYPSKLKKYTDISEIAYNGDVVVSRTHTGKGLGSKLLGQSILHARQQQISTVYIERHEENLASAGMMKRAGFEVVETFHDPDKRTAGTRNTKVLAIRT